MTNASNIRTRRTSANPLISAATADLLPFPGPGRVGRAALRNWVCVSVSARTASRQWAVTQPIKLQQSTRLRPAAARVPAEAHAQGGARLFESERWCLEPGGVGPVECMRWDIFKHTAKWEPMYRRESISWLLSKAVLQGIGFPLDQESAQWVCGRGQVCSLLRQAVRGEFLGSDGTVPSEGARSWSPALLT